MQQSAQKILRRRLLRAIALPIGLLLLLSAISIWQITGLLAAIGWVDHTDQVISQSNQVQKLLLDMETGNRGYLLTGEDTFLEPYQQGSAQIPEALNRLKQLVRDNLEQLRRVEDLQQQQTTWNRLVLQTLTPQQDQAAQTTAQTAALRSRKQEMDVMRGLIANFITTEEQLRDDRVRTVQQTTWLVTVSSVGLAIAMGALLAHFSWQQLRKVAQMYTQMMNSVQENFILLQLVINGTTDAIFMKDRQGRYRLANARTAQILGQSVEAIIGKDDSQFLSPDVLAAVQRVDEAVLQTGRSQVLEEQIPEEGQMHTFLTTKDPYIDAQGNIAGIIGIARDISDRKRSEVQVQKSAQRLAALQAIDRAILRLEAPVDIAQASLLRLQQVVASDQAAILQFDFEQDEFEIIAGEIGDAGAGRVRSISENIAPEMLRYREAVWYIEDLATLIQRSPFEEKLLAAGYHSFLAVALLVQDRFTGDILLLKRQPGAFSFEDREIVQEVADQLAIAVQQAQLRQQLQHHASELEQRVADRTAELSATNQELEAFTYSVSHDLRAPLRTMQGFAQALSEDYGDQLDDIAHSYIESIVEDAKQMSRLIADLLAYSRLSRTQINLQPVDLNAAIADALKQLAAEVQEKQANITVPKSLPSVLAHRTTLVQILANLLSNAVKFVPPGTQPKISISTSIYTKEDRRESQTWVKLTVKDNGIGIAPEHQERIFRVFERLHGVETYPGTGIGLAIVRKGIDRMGGFTGVESQFGQGSQFWIILPKAVLKNSDTHDYSSATD